MFCKHTWLHHKIPSTLCHPILVGDDLWHTRRFIAATVGCHVTKPLVCELVLLGTAQKGWLIIVEIRQDVAIGLFRPAAYWATGVCHLKSPFPETLLMSASNLMDSMLDSEDCILWKRRSNSFGGNLLDYLLNRPRMTVMSNFWEVCQCASRIVPTLWHRRQAFHFCEVFQTWFKFVELRLW